MMRYSGRIHSKQRGLVGNFINKLDGACLISGPAGVGKTVLVETLIDDLAVDAIKIKLDQFGQSESLPIRIIKNIGAAIAHQKDDGLYGYQEALSMCAVMLKELESVLESTLVLFVDDAQWMTDKDLQSVDQIFNQSSFTHLKLVLGFRDETLIEYRKKQLQHKLEKSFTSVVLVSLSSLPKAESRLLLGDVNHPEKMRESQAYEKLIEVSKGIPFFLDLFSHVGFDYMSEDLSSYLMAHLGSETCYIAFVCAQIGFEFRSDIIQSYFSNAQSVAKAELARLVDYKILKESDTEEGAFCFTHDYLYKSARDFFSQEKLHDVNARLFTLLNNLDENERSNSFNIKRALFLLGVNQLFKQSISPTVEMSVFINALESACEDLSVEMGFKIARYASGMILDAQYQELDRIKLCKLIALMAYYKNDLEFAENVLNLSIENTANKTVKAEMYGFLGKIYFSQGLLKDSVYYYRRALAELRIRDFFNGRYGSMLEAGVGMASIHQRYSDSAKLTRLNAECKDSTIILENKVLCDAATSGYSLDVFFAAKLVAKMLANAMRYGRTEETTYGLQLYSTAICCGYLRDYKRALFLSELAFAQNAFSFNQYYVTRSKFLYHCFIGVHQNSIEGNVAALHDSVFNNIRESSIDFAAYAAHVASFHRLDANASLGDVKYWINVYVKSLSAYKQKNARKWMSVLEQFIDDITQNDLSKEWLAGDYFSLPHELRKSEDRSLVFIAHHYRGVLNVLTYRWQEALLDFRVSEKYLDGVLGTYGEYLHQFYRSIAIARSVMTGITRINALRQLKKSKAFLGEPVEIGSKVVLGKIAIIEGYIHMLEKNSLGAQSKFETALRYAKSNGHLMDQLMALDALAHVNPSYPDVLVNRVALCKTWGANVLVDVYSNVSESAP